MKKIILLSVFSLLLGFSAVLPAGGQTLKAVPALPYACEEDWIEVMFSQESSVRMRGGILVDLSTDALQGVDPILNSLAWHKWIRFTDLSESLIDSWETNGERNTGQNLYNLNNIYRLQIPKGLDVWEISGRLESLPGISMAIPVPKPTPLPSPPPGSFQTQQGYLNAATTGIEALWSWTQTGGTGTGVTICDLEYNWNYNHNDVTKAVGSQINPNPLTDPGPGIVNINHGTSVIGELVANNNGWGTTGICYGAGLKTCGTVYAAGGGWNVAGAIGYAIAALSSGDVILLEQQWDYTGSGGYIPIEWWGHTATLFPNQFNNAVYAAIVTAVANGIHVVEAGGNGNFDTGTLTWFGDSGAIIVGAGGTFSTSTNLKRIVPGSWGSSYGPRFNLQGWGEKIVTTGGTYAGAGDLYSAEGQNYYYTQSFAGTSGASPMVAGSIACTEGYYLVNVSPAPPTPAFMRNHLVTWGNAQVTPPAGNIGPRPNIKTAIQNLPTATYDFGDAPDLPYPTKLATNGAKHKITGLKLGLLIDAETDGQSSVNADGDDINPPTADDEDGVLFTTALTPGQIAMVQVTASAQGVLNAWIDFNKTNVWGDPGEFILQNVPLNPGINLLSFQVPATALTGMTYARFRLNASGGILFYGSAQEGEVEDYKVIIEEGDLYDWGDAPDSPYPTLMVSNGASHLIDGITYLGSSVDDEPDGQPETMAFGDDMDILNPPPNDDEDGVMFVSSLIPNQMASITVTASVQGFLNGWIDFNLNGFWGDPGEQVLSDVIISGGLNAITFNIPGSAVTGLTFARFRFSTVQGLGFTGSAQNGEVEDYSVNIEQEPEVLDFGDAPDPSFPTLLVNDGARHLLDGITFMGATVDAEPDGIPDPSAFGDDNNNTGDEDGIQFNWPVMKGSPVMITVMASAGGLLNAWIDFDGDGTWSQANEQIFSNFILTSGTNQIHFIVPANAFSGISFARFRFSTQGGLSYTGLAMDGEVEDYHVMIMDNPELKWKQLPNRAHPGLHACDYMNTVGIHEWITRADDWMCNGGRVTDIHWWGNYELNAGRQERRGSGIQYFHLSIHADNPSGSCLPVDPELWGINVPFSSITEFYTGDTNLEGSRIYRYDFVLPTPFLQMAGTRYWLDITAYSVNAMNPPVWRWQEAIRSNPPILCGAAEKTSPAPATWSTTFFPLANRFTDMAFEITNIPDKTLNLRFFLEGLYNGSGGMIKAQDAAGDHFATDTTDLFRLELHNATTYSTLEYARDSASVDTSGNAVITGIPYTFGNYYYLTVKHRNSIQTVSADSLSFAGNTITYDFTTAASRAYGNNQRNAGGIFVFYSGDVNQDDIIDGGDLSAVDNQSALFAAGYLPEDVNGDGLIDGSDLSIVDNNASAFIGAATP